MNSSRFEMMMNSIKKPCVLRLKLIKDKSPNKPLFIFEGSDDYDFYYHAMNLCAFDKDFSHIKGSGKDQSIALYDELSSENSEFLDGTYFFVDQDYSLFCYSNKNIFTLPFYAIESPLSDNRVIKHFLISSFKLDEANKELIDRLMTFYESAKKDFHEGIKKISIQLYMSRILNLSVEFPSNAQIFKAIKKDSVTFKLNDIPEITSRLKNMSNDEKTYHNIISNLDEELLIRGKYVYYFICEWLMVIKKYIHSRIDSAIALDSTRALPLCQVPKAQYNHTDLSISRLAPSCKKVKEFGEFLRQI